MFKGSFPESVSQQILVGRILVITEIGRRCLRSAFSHAVAIRFMIFLKNGPSHREDVCKGIEYYCCHLIEIALRSKLGARSSTWTVSSHFSLGRGDDTVGNPHRAQTSQFEFFELTISLKWDKHVPIEQFEPTVPQSTVPSPPLDIR